MTSAGNEILRYAIRLLARRDYSGQQLQQKLIRRFGDAGAVQKVMDNLRRLNYLDDFRFAASFARSRMMERRLGPRRIRYELEQLQISPEDIEAAIEQVLREVPEEELLQNAAAKWRRTHRDCRSLPELGKLRQTLLRAGFDAGLVFRHVAELRKSNKEETYEG